ncbi:MAG TPA: SusD/RagB family nutrient-binding outer membrane lipoprotein, partial [Flavihumibacter sp.]
RFIDYLIANSDPRLAAVAEIPPAGIAAASNVALTGDNNPAIQIGLPNGYDMNEGDKDITTAPGYPGGSGTGDDFSPIGKYSRPRAALTTDLNAPVIVMTYAETELLLAEAAVKGWNVTGTAATHYRNAVSAALQTLGTMHPSAAISAGTADTYAAAHPLDESTQAAALEMINTQYWATTGSYFSFVEAWNNWRRSGYPVLTPVSFPGGFSSGQIPRRQIFPRNEASLNGANYNAALSDIAGGDAWIGRVWWDAN